MAFFTRKPVTIEAIQFLGFNTDEILKFTGDACAYQEGKNIIIRTLDGEHIVRIYDWVIKGVKGEFYPCKLNVFLEGYTKNNEPRPS